MTEPHLNQRELVASIAHDLRSPLSVIAGVASRLRDAVPPEVREGLDKIAEETQRATRMLENRVLIALIQSGEPVPREWVSLEEIVGAALARLEARLGARAIRLTIDGDAEAHVDANMAGLLLVNLIDNAARHTPAGSPIDITARREGSQTFLEIADRGPGLTPPIVRAPLDGGEVLHEPSTQRRGLAVCGAIAKAYGGSIAMRAREGGGLVVRVALPDGQEGTTR